MGFSNLNGKLVIEGVGYDSVQHYFNIRLIEGNGESVVTLYEDDELLMLWGIPNTKNYTDLSRIEQSDD